MKGSRLYVLLLFAFLVIVFIAELNAPRKFVWKPTYDKYDREPFGSYVFDDVLSSSIDDYSVVNKTFYQVFQDDSVSGGRAFLLTEEYFHFNVTDIEYIYKLVHLGNQIMICSENLPYRLKDTLRYEVNREKNASFTVKNITVSHDRDSIFFGPDTLHPVQIFEVFPLIHPVSIIYHERNLSDATDYEGDDKEENGHSSDETTSGFTPINCDSVETLVWNNQNKPLAVRAFIGKGEIILVSTPLMFTNFGMLDGSNASYAFRLLSCMKEKRLIRIEAYGKHDDKPQTPLRYILSKVPLRWATYTGMALLILFMIFTAKRRQRIIPVVTAPQNRSLGFMQLISNLYYQKHDNIEMLKMKYMYFCTEVKNLTGVELYEQVPDETRYERLVEKTGMEKDFISLLLQNIRYATYSGEVVDLQLKRYIDGMNDILRSLKT